MRRKNYVVGYKGEGQCIYGKQGSYPEFVDLMTLIMPIERGF